MAEIKFWEEMALVPNLVDTDKLMVGKADSGLTYYTDFNQVKGLFGLNANAVLEASTKTEWENQDNGLFIPIESGVYHGVDVDLTEGFVLLKWDGETLMKILYATKLGTPIKFRLTDKQVVVTEGKTTVTDERLVAMLDYPVLSSQLNNSVFRDDEITYDSTTGSFTLLNFTLLPNEVLVAYPDATGGIGGNNNIVQPLEERLTKLEKMMAPMLTGGRIWWSLELGAIPRGWEEDKTWRDFTPIHAPAPEQIGLTVGTNSHFLESIQQGSFEVAAGRERASGTNGWRQIQKLRFRPTGGQWGSDVTGMNGSFDFGPAHQVTLSSGFKAISLVQKSKYGVWIKYVGV